MYKNLRNSLPFTVIPSPRINTGWNRAFYYTEKHLVAPFFHFLCVGDIPFA